MSTKLEKLRISEVSGVDYPAHLHNGFSVIKGLNGTTAAEFLRRIGNGDGMVKKSTGPTLSADAVRKSLGSVAKGLTAEQLQPIVDAINAAFDSATGAQTPQDGTTPAVPAAPADGAAPAAATADDVTKALEASPIVKALREQVEKAQAQAQAERDARLDAEAVTKSRHDYAHLPVDHETVAPAIRKALDNEATKPIAETLVKALGNAEKMASESALFKELGTESNDPASPDGVLNARADEIMKAEHLSKAQAFRKALDENPAVFAGLGKER